MAVRVEDAGGSECHPVMGWIGVEPRQHHLTRKRADFPAGLASREHLANRLQETKQMTAVATPAGAVSRNTVDWQAQTIVRRLQARIVQATLAALW